MGAYWQPVQMEMSLGRLGIHRDQVNSFEYFGGHGIFELPQLHAESYVPDRLAAWNAQADYAGAAIHSFVEDWRFEGAWRNPPATIPRLASAAAVLTPDFSIWREMPFAVILWQIYRSRWLGAYWQSKGLRVIPTAMWTDPFEEWMLEGLPRGGVLAVEAFSRKTKDETALDSFREGWRAVENTLAPSCILVYGGLRDIIEPTVEVREYPSFVQANRKRLSRRNKEWADEAGEEEEAAAEPEPTAPMRSFAE